MPDKSKVKVSTIVVVAGIAIAVGAFAVFEMQYAGKTREGDSAAASQFVLTGTPCAPLTAEAFDTLRKGREGTPFFAEDYQFVMGYGGSDCHAFRSGEKNEIGADLVCKFNNPTWVKVTTKKGDFHFSTGGGGATVAVKAGEARCVLAG